MGVVEGELVDCLPLSSQEFAVVAAKLILKPPQTNNNKNPCQENSGQASTQGFVRGNRAEHESIATQTGRKTRATGLSTETCEEEEEGRGRRKQRRVQTERDRRVPQAAAVSPGDGRLSQSLLGYRQQRPGAKPFGGPAECLCHAVFRCLSRLLWRRPMTSSGASPPAARKELHRESLDGKRVK